MAVAVAERVDWLQEGYKRKRAPSLCYSEKNIMNRGTRRRQRRHQRGGILPVFLIPAAIAAAKAAAAARAISGAAGYGTKKAIEAATREKRVGKISAAQWAANKRQVQQMLRRRGLPPLASLRMLK